MTNAPGKIFVSFYSMVSPPIAEYIREHQPIKGMVKFFLTPVVYSIEYPFLTVIAGGMTIGIRVYGKRRRHKNS
jgi:hypothetical protein